MLKATSRKLREIKSSKQNVCSPIFQVCKFSIKDSRTSMLFIDNMARALSLLQTWYLVLKKIVTLLIVEKRI